MRHSLNGTYDLCVVGGGSAGLGAALAAARSGLSTVLIEKGNCLGGNAVRGGVHNWEPGVGGTGFPQEIYQRLRDLPLAAGVWSINRHWCWPQYNQPPFPGGELLIDPSRDYADTLHRHGTRGLVPDVEKVRAQWHGVMFEPEPYATVAAQMLQETGCCDIRLDTAFLTAETDGRRVRRIQVRRRDGGLEAITARVFADATADALLCRAAGCDAMIGEDEETAFGEPSAMGQANPRAINAITLVYRVTPSAPGIGPLPADVAAACWFRTEWGGASVGQYPCGDLNVNMLPTMEGDEFHDYIQTGPDGYHRAYRECRRRVLGHWHHIQTHYPEFARFRLKWIAPALGVRETHRIVGDYVLTEHDLRAGLGGQAHEDVIALADHAIDVHGRGSRNTRNGCPELEQPYGVPYRCLVPRGWKNLLVAGRCASFSHIAASSCRLSRTMMDLGHAAGLGAALALESGHNVAEVDTAALRRLLMEQGATLEVASPTATAVCTAGHTTV